MWSPRLCAVIPLLLVIHPPAGAQRCRGKVTPSVLLRDVREGLRYVQARPGLVAVLIMAMVINFLLQPGRYAHAAAGQNHFQGGAWQLSLMESAWGIGMIAGSLVLSAWGGFKSQIFTSMTGLIGMGAGALIVGFTPGSGFCVAVVGYVLAGIDEPDHQRPADCPAADPG